MLLCRRIDAGMIAALHGTLRARESRAILLDVGGVTFRVFTGGRLLKANEGEEVECFTYLRSTDETLELYGFSTTDELGLFQSLLKVSGVGPRSALAILSETPASELRQAIINADPLPLTRVSGIGKKTAERIILELSGTLVQQAEPKADDALDALERLGYSRREASEALRQVDGSITDVRDRLRAALRALNKKP